MDTFSNLLYVRWAASFAWAWLSSCALWISWLDYHLVALDTRKIRVSFSCLDHFLLFFFAAWNLRSWVICSHNPVRLDKYRVETCCVIGKSHFFLSRFMLHVSNPNNKQYKNIKKRGGSNSGQSRTVIRFHCRGHGFNLWSKNWEPARNKSVKGNKIIYSRMSRITIIPLPRLFGGYNLWIFFCVNSKDGICVGMIIYKNCVIIYTAL